MHYSEKNTSNIKPLTAFLLAMGMILFVYVLFTVIFKVLEIKTYHTVYQVVIILIAAWIVFFLYRYAMTVHEYRIEDDTFFIIRSDGSRSNTIAAIKNENVISVRPVSRGAADIPSGDLTVINACSKHSGRTDGWQIFCKIDSKTFRVIIDPTDQLKNRLSELFPGKVDA